MVGIDVTAQAAAQRSSQYKKETSRRESSDLSANVTDFWHGDRSRN